jgi:hypothetical protein
MPRAGRRRVSFCVEGLNSARPYGDQQAERNGDGARDLPIICSSAWRVPKRFVGPRIRYGFPVHPCSASGQSRVNGRHCAIVDGQTARTVPSAPFRLIRLLITLACRPTYLRTLLAHNTHRNIVLNALHAGDSLRRRTHRSDLTFVLDRTVKRDHACACHDADIGGI